MTKPFESLIDVADHIAAAPDRARARAALELDVATGGYDPISRAFASQWLAAVEAFETLKQQIESEAKR